MINMNYILLASSIAFTATHLLTLLHHPNVSCLYAFLLMRGCLSSIVNHASTNEIAKWYDQNVMLQSFFVDVFYIIETNSINSAGFTLLVAAISFFAGKLIGIKLISTALHLYSHICITVCHVMIITAH